MDVRRVLSGFGMVALLSISALSAQASTGKTTGPKHEGPTHLKNLTLPATDDQVLSKQEFAALKKEVRELTERKVANEPILNDSLLSKEYIAFRTRLLAVSLETKNKTGVDLPEQLDAILTEAAGMDDAHFAALPDDLKLFVAVFAPLHSLKSFVFRVRPFVSDTPIVQSALLTSIRSLLAVNRILIPTDQMEAITRYVTEPMHGMGDKITTSDDFKTFLANELYMATVQMSRRLGSFKLIKPVVWDNQLLYGSASYQDDLDRYRSVGFAEQLAIRSAVYSSLSQLSVSIAYSLSDIMSVANDLGKLYGVNVTVHTYDPFSDGIQGAKARDRVKHLREHTNYGMLEHAGSLTAAGNYYKKSVQYGIAAWEKLKDRPASQTSALDPAIFNAISRQMKVGVENLEAMIQDQPAKIHSRVTGEVVTVDVMKFFTAGPADAKDLLPTDFLPGALELSRDVDGQPVKYRNYMEGRASNWDFTAEKGWGKILPDTHTAKDMEQALKILSQAWGGTGPAAILGGLTL